MSRPAFTPGPWRWWTSNSWRRLSSDHGDFAQDGGVLCPCVSHADGHPDLIVREADMALIAAAPDMFEALQEAREQVAILQARLGITDEGNGTLSIIDAALARASAADAEREYVRAA